LQQTKKPGIVLHACNFSYVGGVSRRIAVGPSDSMPKKKKKSLLNCGRYWAKLWRNNSGKQQDPREGSVFLSFCDSGICKQTNKQTKNLQE
jgi:hypothetical protein